MTLTEILNSIEAQRGFLTADLSPNVINGRIPGQEIARIEALAIAQRQANDNIADLRSQYDRTLYGSSVVVFAAGGTLDKREAFVAKAVADEALCVDADAFYRGIAAQAEARMSGQRIMNTSVGQEITESLAVSIGKLAPGSFLEYPKLPSQYVDSVIKNLDEIVEIVKASAQPCTVIPLGVTWLERNVASIAYSQKFTAEPLAVVVTMANPADLPAWKSFFMRGSPRVAVNLNEELTADELLQTAKDRLRETMQPQS